MIIYIVKQGDTINDIANKYNTTSEFLITQNMLENPDNLVIGQTIVIPNNNNNKLGEIATNGYLYTNIDPEILNKTLKYLTFATIFTYGFDNNADLIIPEDDKVLDIILKTDTKPILLISTLGSDGQFSNELANILLNNKQLQYKLIYNLISVMQNKNYYGLDIDFEYVLPEDKDAFIDFIATAREVFNSYGYPIITSLAPKVSSDQKGLLYEAHDYKSIGENSDAVLLMTYEWGYTYGPPMAVAPLNSVKKVLDYAITEIPTNKIFMGIPNYGYDWKLPYIKGETKAQSIGNVEAVNIAFENNATIKYDDIAQSPYFSYYKQVSKDNQDNQEYNYNYNPEPALEPEENQEKNQEKKQETFEEHIVWFEDARSIEAKLLTAYNYNFTGVSFWNIMRYFPQNWLVLENMFDIYKIK